MVMPEMWCKSGVFAGKPFPLSVLSPESRFTANHANRKGQGMSSASCVSVVGRNLLLGCLVSCQDGADSVPTSQKMRGILRVQNVSAEEHAQLLDTNPDSRYFAGIASPKMIRGCATWLRPCVNAGSLKRFLGSSSKRHFGAGIANLKERATFGPNAVRADVPSHLSDLKKQNRCIARHADRRGPQM
jgi:hypothetical protein